MAKKHRIYSFMVILGICSLVFGASATLSTESNQYSAYEYSVHGDTDYIHFWTPDHTRVSLYLGITEDEYRDSMLSLGMRQGFIFGHVPTYLVCTDRAVKTIGDYFMEQYSSDYKRATAVLYLCQTGIKYAEDTKVYGAEEFWARPIETLYHLKGDCEDTAILFRSICEYMGIKTIFLDGDGHLGCAVRVDASGDSYEFEGETYYACTTTFSSVHPIGETGFNDVPLWVAPSEHWFNYYFYSFAKQAGDRVEAWVCSL